MRRIEVNIKRKIREYIVRALGSRYNQEWVNAVSESYNHKKKYEEFLTKFTLRNFQSASEVALGLNLQLLSVKEKLVVVKCYYSSSYGVLADQLLEELCQKVLSEGQTNTRLIVTLLERISISGFELSRKLSLFSRAKTFFDISNAVHLKQWYSILWMEYTLRNEVNGATDPRLYIKDEDVSTHGATLISKFIPSLKAFGHGSYVRSILIDSYKNNGIRNVSDLKIFISFLPEYIRDEGSIELDVPLNHESVSVLPVLFSGRTLHRDIDDLYTKVFEYLNKEFRDLELPKQDVFLRFLLKQERYKEILSLAQSASGATKLLPVFLARGFESLASDDYLSARDCFQHVLIQDPSDTLASTGMRFALPRVGRSMSEILNLRDKIGFGTQGGGRTGIRDIGGELTISLLMSGDYIRGQYSKRQSKHWVALKEHYGDRFLNFERLDGTRVSSIFIIGDEGVGDEIRTSQFYAELSRFYKNIIVTCDPRLLNIFKASFPQITFIPVPRIRKILGNSESHEGARLNGFGEKVSNYLTEECRPFMDGADVVTFGQNVFFNYVLGEISRPDPGAYLITSDRKKVLPPTKKLRVGILWRSHLRIGARKMMYLDIEDFAPLLEFEEIEVWSIQHSIDDQEFEYCKENNIKVIEDVDLFNDFEGLGDYLGEMDLLIGVSSVPMELGAALGAEVWMLGFSPENYFLRTAGGTDSHDRYTMNSTVIAPPWIDFSNPRSLCVKQVFEEVSRLIELKLRGNADEVVIS